MIGSKGLAVRAKIHHVERESARARERESVQDQGAYPHPLVLEDLLV